MQIQPKWHKERMAQINAKNLMIPKDNFRTGANFLAELLSKHELTDSLTYYNQGHFGNSNYANSVIKAMNYWKEVIKTNGCENY